MFMHIAHTVRNTSKLLNLNVLNYTVVLKLCESVVASAWDCLVPGWILVLSIILFLSYLEELEKMLLRQRSILLRDRISAPPNKFFYRFTTLLFNPHWMSATQQFYIYCFSRKFGLSSLCWLHPDFLFGGGWRIAKVGNLSHQAQKKRLWEYFRFYCY